MTDLPLKSCGTIRPARRAALPALLILLLMPSCVALVPFIESDYVPPEQVSYGSPEGWRPQRVTRRVKRTQTKLNRLVRNLSNPDPVIRTHAATDLGAMGAAATPAVDQLIQAMERDESKWVRRAAVKALAKIGSQRAVEPLRRATRDRDRYVAQSARNALRKLASNS